MAAIDLKSFDCDTSALPEWLAMFFAQSFSSGQSIAILMNVSTEGIELLHGMPRVLRALQGNTLLIATVLGERAEPSDAERKAIRDAEETAKLADREFAQGFPLLHSFGAVAVWSWLENSTKGLVAQWIANMPEALSNPAVQKLKLRLGDYLQTPESERGYLIADLLEQDQASALKRGVSRFQTLLEPFDLDAHVSKECADAIFELQQVRNAIAHRDGVADRRFFADCPWLRAELNQRIPISSDQLSKYALHALTYWRAVLARVQAICTVESQPT